MIVFMVNRQSISLVNKRRNMNESSVREKGEREGEKRRIREVFILQLSLDEKDCAVV